MGEKNSDLRLDVQHAYVLVEPQPFFAFFTYSDCKIGKSNVTSVSNEKEYV